MFNTRSVLLAVCLVFLMGSRGLKADIISLTGTLFDPNAVFTSEFTLTQVSEVNLQSWGYGGGLTANNTVIPAGGFDPIVGLFLGTGTSAILLDFNDDGTCPPGNSDAVTGGCLDSTLSEVGLLPGTYTLSVSASANLPNGPTFGDGFSGGGDFLDVFGDLRTNSFAVDIVTTAAPSAVPEPSTFCLVALCLAVVALTRGRTPSTK